MLSLINLSVSDRRKTVISHLHAVFAGGYTHGLFASDTALLRPLLECIAGQRSRYTGSILYNDAPLVKQDVTYTNCRSIKAPPENRMPESVFVRPGSVAGKPPFSRLTPPGSGLLPSHADPTIDFSKKVLLLHDLRTTMLSDACATLPDQLRQHAIPGGRTVLISSHDYQALRDTCDYIYLFDKKRFPIVVEKADFTQFDDYFRNVFRSHRPY